MRQIKNVLEIKPFIFFIFIHPQIFKTLRIILNNLEVKVDDLLKNAFYPRISLTVYEFTSYQQSVVDEKKHCLLCIIPCIRSYLRYCYSSTDGRISRRPNKKKNNIMNDKLLLGIQTHATYELSANARPWKYVSQN